ncbi:tRNA (adenosine(37)-N6)-threonylcarbamoyltransferase complex dimerization subunit type 1 TsaB [Criblamydia sequanensis]|uniref:Metalloprotease n=1 Tax=Candidatus Criblamydia sequanensis CRIB-18 TaxID=1437425 RepID=A0A090DXI6_9BACT|nr:tRNA (adenosine(37)-N6)-threonylcarbamoyltransferase complex dimerization subunit type 1 TsaB [Criblamydia sequanensis]CDR33519.1 Metalloprotease [Criblamydia sequanensis CRIB-18]
MKRLCIETATEWGVVAFLEEDKLLFQAKIEKGLQNSKFLLPELERGIKEIGWEFEDLSYILCGVGPGSYTGIRIGASAAKALSFASRVPLIGISTLACFSPSKEGDFAVVLDAKISGFYVLFGEKKGDVMEYKAEPRIATLGELEEKIKPGIEVITPDLSIQKKLEKLTVFPEIFLNERAPDPFFMVKRGDVEFNLGNFSKDSELELLYLRKTQAEENRKEEV